MPKLEGALLELAPGSAPSRAVVTTTYFDTADRTLRQRGLSLRVREAGGRFVQTVKADSEAEAGLLVRGEWEDEIAGRSPDPRAPLSGSRLPEGIGDALEPLFVTAVTRTTIGLEPSPSQRIEADIDEGEIRGIAAPAHAPISEIELELKEGEPAALFDAAMALLAVAPLRIEARSKAERGYAAVAGDTASARAVRAETVAIDPAMTIEVALQSMGRACLAHLLRNEPAALAGSPEGVHQMRVASRRIRSALSAFKRMLPAAERDWVSGELNGLDDVLGAARNLDVFADDLLAPALQALAAEPALDRLAAAVEAARQAAYERVRERILSSRHTEAMLRLLRWFEMFGSRTDRALGRSDLSAERIGDVAPRLLDRRLHSVRKRGKGFRHATAREKHKLRIALKKLRYTGELLGSLFDPQAVRRFGKRLRTLQDDLGYANDVRVGSTVLAELCARDADRDALAAVGERVLAWHEQRLCETEGKVSEDLRRLKRAAPYW